MKDEDTEKTTRPEELLERLSGITDMKQRSYALATRLSGMENADVLHMLGFIRDKVLAGRVEFVRLYHGLLVSGTLADVLGNRRMSELVAEAQEIQAFEIVSLLMDALPEPDDHTPFSATTSSGAETPDQPFLDAGLKEMPLGVRKFLARKPDFSLIKRITRDQDHRVISNLLYNSRLTELDVVRIVATRPASPKVIEAVYNHPKWITRYRVKKAIVLNPNTPLSIAMRLVALMSVQDLEELVQSQDLHWLLIREARKLIERKSHRTTNELPLPPSES